MLPIQVTSPQLKYFSYFTALQLSLHALPLSTGSQHHQGTSEPLQVSDSRLSCMLFHLRYHLPSTHVDTIHHTHILALLSSPTEGQFLTPSKGDSALTGRQQGGTTYQIKRQLRRVGFTTSLIGFLLCFLGGP